MAVLFMQGLRVVATCRWFQSLRGVPPKSRGCSSWRGEHCQGCRITRSRFGDERARIAGGVLMCGACAELACADDSTYANFAQASEGGRTQNLRERAHNLRKRTQKLRKLCLQV